jgi:dienelactone hydrolase
MKPNCCAITVAPDITLYHSGPSLDLGPLPSFFYFAVSGNETLLQEPFNQPVEFLNGQMIRVFSMTLPGHEGNLLATKAIEVWADDYAHQRDPLNDFLDQFEIALSFAIQQKFVDPDKMAIGGLSRGGFIALHAAARDQRMKYVLGFAPVTDLHKVEEFSSLEAIIPILDLKKVSRELIHQNIRLYISNRDTRVDTRSCFEFAMSVVESANQHQIRSPKVELILYPPVGHHGHGTPLEIFKAGADWIASCLK